MLLVIADHQPGPTNETENSVKNVERRHNCIRIILGGKLCVFIDGLHNISPADDIVDLLHHAEEDAKADHDCRQGDH